MTTIDRNTKPKEIYSFIEGPYFALCNDYDNKVAEWIVANCQSFDEKAQRILKKVQKLCPRDQKNLSPTISEILKLIILKPWRFTGKDKPVYKTVLSLRNRAPWAWEAFLKNAEKVNKHKDWMRLWHDFGYDGPRDYWEPGYYSYVVERLKKKAKK